MNHPNKQKLFQFNKKINKNGASIIQKVTKAILNAVP